MTAELEAEAEATGEDAVTVLWDANYQSVHVDWNAEPDTEVSAGGNTRVPPTSPGAMIFSRYQVGAVIGRGGTGVVVRARDGRIGRDVAIKLLKPELAEDPQQVDRFLREARAMLALRGDHVARVLDFGTLPDGVPAMVMELLDGPDLSRVLQHEGPQHPGTVVGWMLQACEGLAEAHALGIIHRDIKLSNLVITRTRGGEARLKLVDFGTSKLSDPLDEPTGAAAVLGTPPYMAPEHLWQSRAVDQRSDIWSLGVVMYRLLTGRMPFEPETIVSLRAAVSSSVPAPLHVAMPVGLGEIVLRCLERDPARRFQNVAELARALGRYSLDPVMGWASVDRARRLLGAPLPPQPQAPAPLPTAVARPHRPTPRVVTVGSARRAAMSFHSFGVIVLTAAAVIGTVAGAFAGRETRANAAPAVMTAPEPAPEAAPEPAPEPPPPAPEARPAPVPAAPPIAAPPMPAVDVVIPVERKRARATHRHRSKRPARKPATKVSRAAADDDDLFAHRR
jgi:eukaryotic-like serine/threonine-protein kinase